jgi:hypothetical protein
MEPLGDISGRIVRPGMARAGHVACAGALASRAGLMRANRPTGPTSSPGPHSRADPMFSRRFLADQWMAARACADDKRSGTRGGLRPGKPHHRQLFPVDARPGADVATDWPVQPNPPLRDHPHTRAAYAKWLHAQQARTPTPAVHPSSTRPLCCPNYAYLAAQVSAVGPGPARPKS